MLIFFFNLSVILRQGYGPSSPVGYERRGSASNRSGYEGSSGRAGGSSGSSGRAGGSSALVNQFRRGSDPAPSTGRCYDASSGARRGRRWSDPAPSADNKHGSSRIEGGYERQESGHATTSADHPRAAAAAQSFGRMRSEPDSGMWNNLH